jgi:hypothetical protein
VDLTCASCHALIDESALSANPDFDIRLIRARILVPIKEIYPGNNPMLIVERNSSLSDIGNSEVSSPFVDRMVVLDVPRRGGERRTSYPLLDRAGKTRCCMATRCAVMLWNKRPIGCSNPAETEWQASILGREWK